ncbi:cellulose biosynthesis cyclic di-GMP-binding regulatory protein BcsB [Frigidibacter mobilis]|uniref:Cyclic di-GMP-binding protein n=1 Tax=Frigidibacter mobilis TaxID=1335048 RepID=A0A159Z518_9RHOB|nr:cellulose biosynthesis cyclic di-GMP-binding regulatory protein BcsB [Frigidibacter mobilis]AMY70305.1 putative cellulose synthase [Frigidibacter mobilis]
MAPGRGASSGDLVVAYRSSINVLPERSQLSLRVNGELAGAFLLTSFANFTPVTLRTSALRPGLNRIQIDVAHHHRIFCGPEASFAVWTELLLPQSGVRVDTARIGVDAAGFLAAVSAQVASGAPIDIRAEGALDPQLLRHLASRLTGTLSATPDFRIVSTWTPQTGAPPKARITVLQGGTGRASIEQGGDGAVVLLLDPASGWSCHWMPCCRLSRPAAMATKPSCRRAPCPRATGSGDALCRSRPRRHHCPRPLHLA